MSFRSDGLLRGAREERVKALPTLVRGAKWHLPLGAAPAAIRRDYRFPESVQR